ncbi:hypothetical protein ACFX13_019378 [Malus domestica]
MFSESETEARPEVETSVRHRARSVVVEFLDSEPKWRSQARLYIPVLKSTPTKKKTRSQTSQASRSLSALLIEEGRKKQKAASK